MTRWRGEEPPPEDPAPSLDARRAQGVQQNQSGGNTQNNNYFLPPRPPVSWPQRVGSVPGLASAFQERDGFQQRIDAARTSGSGVVLTQVLSGGGGVGKSQLAAWYADRAIQDGADLVVWVDASAPEAVVSAYAEAADRLQAPGADRPGPETAARALLDWLSTTERSWLVVLDDITDPDAVAGWWPASHTGTGWVLATTRRRDAALFGNGRVRVDIDVYEPQESAAYLQSRLSPDHSHLLDDGADTLAEHLGYLPLALSQAAAYMINEDVSCSEYVELFTAGESRLAELMSGANPDGYRREVAVTLLLALDAAQASEPVGLAMPAIRLAALLDPAGHPEALWTTPAVIEYFTAHRTGPDVSELAEPVTAGQARKVLRLLDRYGLVTHERKAAPRSVRMHALTARVARESTPSAQKVAAVRAGADALLRLWPESDHTDWELAAVLRANTDVLKICGGDTLWQPDGYPVMYRAGRSLLDAGLYGAGTTYWEDVLANAMRVLRDDHPDTLKAFAWLATSYRHVGRTADAITIQEKLVTDSERACGRDHPDTVTTRNNLATSYQDAGRTADAITILEKVVADGERVLGTDHPHTLTARNNLATSYWQAGRTADAITILEKVVADRERVLGTDHPHTLRARNNLAVSYWHAGRTKDAVTVQEEVVTNRERVLGPDHPDTRLAAEALRQWRNG